MKRSILNHIEDIYEAAVNPSHWPYLVSQFEREFKSPCVGFFTQNTVTHEFNPVLVRGISDYFLDSYGRYYCQINPWYKLDLTKPRILLTDQTVNKIKGDNNAFYNTDFFCDWMRPLGYKHSMGMALASEDDKLINLFFHREKLSGYYTEHEKNNFKKLSGALTHAMHISKRLQYSDLRNFSSACLVDGLDTGILMLSKNMEIIYCNAYAENLLREESAICSVNNKLNCVPGKSQSLFLGWIREVLLQKMIPIQPHQLVGGKSGSSLTVSAFPIDSKTKIFSLLKPSVVLLVSRMKVDKTENYKLQKLYDLTPREMDIAKHLYNGHTLKETAELLEISYTTVRWHLKTIFQKTGVHRQAELIKILSIYLLPID